MTKLREQLRLLYNEAEAYITRELSKNNLNWEINFGGNILFFIGIERNSNESMRLVLLIRDIYYIVKSTLKVCMLE